MMTKRVEVFTYLENCNLSKSLAQETLKNSGLL